MKQRQVQYIWVNCGNLIFSTVNGRIDQGSFSDFVLWTFQDRWIMTSFNIPRTYPGTLSPTIMEVENCPKWKETNIRGTHFPLPWLWEEGYPHYSIWPYGFWFLWGQPKNDDSDLVAKNAQHLGRERMRKVNEWLTGPRRKQTLYSCVFSPVT